MDSSLNYDDSNDQSFLANLSLEHKNYGVIKQYPNRLNSYSRRNNVRIKTEVIII